jgi:plasmid stabilization system protein ParE
MVMEGRKITWTKLATRQFKAAIKFIRKESEQNADKVKATILEKVNNLSDDRLVHRKDPYKKNNDGNFLYFEILRYRIVYYVEPKEIFIIRIRHTSMEPKKY